MTTAVDIYAAYRQVMVDEARRPPSEWTFKSNPVYRQILEHVSSSQGAEYLEVIQKDFPVLWRSFRRMFARIAEENDALGAPLVHDYPEFGMCSPTNLRYLHQALMVWQHILDVGLSSVHVVELGGGYGGLALYVSRLASLYRVHLRSYTIVDLPEACAIQNMFLRILALNVRTVDGTDSIVPVIGPLSVGSERFFVSAYAYSEFSPVVQAGYAPLIEACSHGLLVWNGGPVPAFTDRPLTVVDERPLTGIGNTVVRF